MLTQLLARNYLFLNTVMFTRIVLLTALVALVYSLSPEFLPENPPRYELGICPSPGSRLACSPNYGQTTAILNLLKNQGKGFQILTAGTSVQGRPIRYAKFGVGPNTYYIWGRIHGNECVGTGALLRVLDRLTDGSSLSAALWQKLTVIILPIANPDGSEAFTRQNANGVDLNRDWCMQGQDLQPSSCNASRTQFPPYGVENPPCSCGIDTSQFTQPETNALWNVFLQYLPDATLDIHQFGTAYFPGTTQLVTGMVVLPSYKSVYSEPLSFDNWQIAQTIYNSIRDLGFVATRYPSNFRIGLPGNPGVSSNQISLSGRRNINDNATARSTMGLEMRRVCPKYEHNLERTTADIVWDLLMAMANGQLFAVNPKEATRFPVGVSQNSTAVCTVSCSGHSDEDDGYEARSGMWSDNDQFSYRPEIRKILAA